MEGTYVGRRAVEGGEGCGRDVCGRGGEGCGRATWFAGWDRARLAIARAALAAVSASDMPLVPLPPRHCVERPAEFCAAVAAGGGRGGDGEVNSLPDDEVGTVLGAVLGAGLLGVGAAADAKETLRAGAAIVSPCSLWQRSPTIWVAISSRFDGCSRAMAASAPAASRCARMPPAPTSATSGAIPPASWMSSWLAACGPAARAQSAAAASSLACSLAS